LRPFFDTRILRHERTPQGTRLRDDIDMIQTMEALYWEIDSCCPGSVSGIPDNSTATVGKPVIGGAFAPARAPCDRMRFFPTEINQ
jgi:hypothetical protein